MRGYINCAYSYNVNQLPSGKVSDNFFCYYSNGNLAAGIAAWQDYSCFEKVGLGKKRLLYENI